MRTMDVVFGVKNKLKLSKPYLFNYGVNQNA